MPRVAELREIDGEIWCRVGAPGRFPSTIFIYTREEVEQAKKDAVNAYIFEQKAKDVLGESEL